MYTVESILKNRLTLQGDTVTIEGFLVADLDSAFIYNSKTEIASKNFVKITDRTFIKTCMKNIPCYVGGAYIYYDNILIKGSLNKEPENDMVIMPGVSYLYLRREEKSYEIYF